MTPEQVDAWEKNNSGLRAEKIGREGDGDDVSAAPVEPEKATTFVEPTPNLGDIDEFFEVLRSCGATRVVIAALDDTKPSGRQMIAHLFRLDDPALTQRVVAHNLNKENLYMKNCES